MSRLFVAVFCGVLLARAVFGQAEDSSELVELYLPVVVDGQAQEEDVLAYLEHESVVEKTNESESSAWRNYVVQPGDELGSIARRLFGKSEKWEYLYQVNNDVVTDPDVIEPGMVLRYKVDFDIVSDGTGIYKVVPGDNLHNIARKIYGDDERWEEIWKVNRARLESKDEIEVGTSLEFNIEGQIREEPNEDTVQKIKRLFFQSQPLVEAIRPKLQKEFVDRILQSEFEFEGEKFFDLLTLRKLGLDVVFNEGELLLIVKTPAEFRRTGDYSIHYDKKEAPKVERRVPSSFSSYANFFVSQPYVVASSTTNAFERSPLSIGLDGATNIKRYVVDWQADYDESSEDKWRRISTRLIKDFPDDLVRMTLGDNTPATAAFQGSKNMAGLSVSSEFNLQPNRLFIPTTDQTLFLKSDSEVRIFQNGRQIALLNLPAGSHRIKDLALLPGANNIVFEIKDRAGRIERVELSLLSSRRLLQKGLHEFSYNVGAPSTVSGSDLDYDERETFVTLFHRYGFSNQWTSGLNLQGDKDLRLLGFENLLATHIGFWTLDTSFSYHEIFGEGFAGRLTFTKEQNRDQLLGKIGFSASAQKNSENFINLSSDNPQNTTDVTLEAALSFRMPGNISTQLSGDYEFLRGGSTDKDYAYSVSLGFSRNFFSSLSLNLNGTHQFNGTIESQTASIFMSWSPAPRHSVNYSSNTRSSTHNMSYQYRPDGGGRGLDAQARASVAPTANSYTVGAGYRGNRGAIGLVHSATEREEQNQIEQGGVLSYSGSLAFAGGLLSWGESISDSFVIVKRPDGDVTTNIKVNPTSDGGSEATASFFGDGIVSNVSSYRPYEIFLDGEAASDTIQLSPDQLTFDPTFKSGLAIEVEGKINLLAEGYLFKPDGQPLELSACELVSKTDESLKIEFFTSDDGYFFIEKGEPGEFWLSIKGGDYPPIPITLRANDEGLVELGEIRLRY